MKYRQGFQLGDQEPIEISTEDLGLLKALEAVGQDNSQVTKACKLVYKDHNLEGYWVLFDYDETDEETWDGDDGWIASENSDEDYDGFVSMLLVRNLR